MSDLTPFVLSSPCCKNKEVEIKSATGNVSFECHWCGACVDCGWIVKAETIESPRPAFTVTWEVRRVAN